MNKKFEEWINDNVSKWTPYRMGKIVADDQDDQKDLDKYLDELLGVDKPADNDNWYGHNNGNLPKSDDDGLLPFELDSDEEPTVKTDPPCLHPNKYLNRVSPNLSFWFCPDCKKELKGE